MRFKNMPSCRYDSSHWSSTIILSGAWSINWAWSDAWSSNYIWSCSWSQLSPVFMSMSWSGSWIYSK